MVTCLLAQSDWSRLAVLLPPGSVYFGSIDSPDAWWLIGPLSVGVLTLLIARLALRNCEFELHRWYGQNHASKVVS
jgi:hypothetical protein